ncbi:MAG TPA: transporter [Candidatus Saccharimonadales bacterium]|jgi:hypothetical protein|nr:transporter [Candidatus Saccharimonadales bacterium]
MGHIGLLLSMAVLLATPSLSGQTVPNPEEPISTDRPSIANSSVVVPKGGFQIENGLLITGAQGQWVFDAPETSLRYGVFRKTELRLSIPDYFHGLPGSAAVPSGFSDTSIGIKQQLGPLRAVDLSLIFFLSLPSGATEVSSHGYDPALQLPWSRKLSANWTIGGQMAFYWPTLAGRHTFTGESTFLLDRQLAKRWDAFAEYAADIPERGGPRHLLHFGSSYKLAPRHQIDFHAAAGLSGAAPDSFVGFGYSFLFRSRQ